MAAGIFAVLALRGTGLGFVMITVALGRSCGESPIAGSASTNGDNGITITAARARSGCPDHTDALHWATLIVHLVVAVVSMAIFVALRSGRACGARDQPRRMNALLPRVDDSLSRLPLLRLLERGAGLLYLYYKPVREPAGGGVEASRRRSQWSSRRLGHAPPGPSRAGWWW